MKSNKIIAYIILVLAIMSEYFHLLFMKGGKQIYHSQKILENGEVRKYYLDDLVYFFVNELFTLFIIFIVFIKLRKHRAAKTIMTGIVFWYIIEFIEITLQLAHINYSRLYINDGSWLQLSTCVTIGLLVLFRDRKLSS